MQGRLLTPRPLVDFVRDGCSSLALLASLTPITRPGAGPPPDRQSAGFLRRAPSLHEVVITGVEYLIRQARITDIDRLAAIGRPTMPGRGGRSPDAADLLRQLVYLPNASLLVAEARREIVGGGLLVLRPSVAAGGDLGTIDFLVAPPAHDADRGPDALVEEILRSASNKGCSAVEAGESSDPAGLARLERAGFAPAGTSFRRPLAAAGAARRH